MAKQPRASRNGHFQTVESVFDFISLPSSIVIHHGGQSQLERQDQLLRGGHMEAVTVFAGEAVPRPRGSYSSTRQERAYWGPWRRQGWLEGKRARKLGQTCGLFWEMERGHSNTTLVGCNGASISSKPAGGRPPSQCLQGSVLPGKLASRKACTQGSVHTGKRVSREACTQGSVLTRKRVSREACRTVLELCVYSPSTKSPNGGLLCGRGRVQKDGSSLRKVCNGTPTAKRHVAHALCRAACATSRSL